MEVDYTDTLLDAVGDLSRARELAEIQEVVRRAARRLVEADGATFIIRDGEHCFYADEDAISPLWKGQRFPLESCISGWSMLHGTSVAIEDIYDDGRVPHEAYRPTFVKSLVMTPIRAAEPLGAIGMYWADHHVATEREMVAARSLADSTAVALENVSLHQQLERAAELAQTDFLTGLANRRAWDETLRTAVQPGGEDFCVAIADLDGFKQFNDRNGHQAGDILLGDLGRAWKDHLRTDEFVARLGGDEFAILIVGCNERQGARIVQRLKRAVPQGVTISAGIAQWDRAETAGQLFDRADRALYAAKRSADTGISLASLL